MNDGPPVLGIVLDQLFSVMRAIVEEHDDAYADEDFDRADDSLRALVDVMQPANRLMVKHTLPEAIEEDIERVKAAAREIWQEALRRAPQI